MRDRRRGKRTLGAASLILVTAASLSGITVGTVISGVLDAKPAAADLFLGPDNGSHSCDQYNVPSNVVAVTITVVGDRGTPGGGVSAHGGGAGGRGGKVTATVPVTPGHTLYTNVEDIPAWFNGPASGATGGNGGEGSYVTTNAECGPLSRTGVLVAAGGGGGGGGGDGFGPGGTGGDAGAAGNPGGNNEARAGAGGGGGTTSAGGAGWGRRNRRSRRWPRFPLPGAASRAQRATPARARKLGRAVGGTSAAGAGAAPAGTAPEAAGAAPTSSSREPPVSPWARQRNGPRTSRSIPRCIRRRRPSPRRRPRRSLGTPSPTRPPWPLHLPEARSTSVRRRARRPSTWDQPQSTPPTVRRLSRICFPQGSGRSVRTTEATAATSRARRRRSPSRSG